MAIFALFFIIINDLPKVVRCLIKLPVDDAKLYQVIKSDKDQVILQNDIENTSNWVSVWKMFFNTKNVNICRLETKIVKE